MNDRELLDAYRTTVWTGTSSDGRVFRCAFEPGGGAEIRRIWNADSFAIITAWNPASRRLPDEENAARNRDLEADLVRLGHAPVACVGVGRDGWSEPSFLVPGIALDEALALGRRYEQNAVVWGEDGGQPRLLITREGFAGQAFGAVLEPEG